MKVFKWVLILALTPLLIMLLAAVKIAAKLKSKRVGNVSYIVNMAPSNKFLWADKNQLIALAGIFAVYVPPGALKEFRKDKTKPAKDRFVSLFVQTGYCVNVVTDILPDLSKEELEAVIAHEIGHIAHGHLVGQTGVINNLSSEMEADDFAAAHTSAIAFKSALTKIRDHNIDRIQPELLEMVNHRIERLN
jgi:Zn-dependent protease with chaperone function